MIDWALKRWADSMWKSQFEHFMRPEAVQILMQPKYCADPETEQTVCEWWSEPLCSDNRSSSRIQPKTKYLLFWELKE